MEGEKGWERGLEGGWGGSPLPALGVGPPPGKFWLWEPIILDKVMIRICLLGQ